MGFVHNVGAPGKAGFVRFLSPVFLAILACSAVDHSSAINS